MIERIQGDQAPGRCQASAYKDLVWVVASPSDETLDLVGQTKQTLTTLDRYLKQFGTDKTKIISAHVFIANIDDKPIMDGVWREWVGVDPQHWPQRACLGVELGGNWLIEITVTALRSDEN